MLGWILFAILGLICLVTSPIWIPAIIIIAPILGFWLFVLYLGLKYFGHWTFIHQKISDAWDWLLYRSLKPRKWVWRFIYGSLCWIFPAKEWKLLNYGYAEKSQTGYTLELDPEEELERYQYQMYHFIATAFKKLKNLEGIHILDIGSGRGGGLAYIVKRLKPITAVGIDISSKQVDFCNQTYNFPNLKFAQGDAENLPVHDSCVDIVINIESSHCYSNFSAFVSEVARALKPGGHFIITDFVYRSDLENKENILNSNVLQLIDKEEITENVILSLNFDSERKEDMLDKAPWLFQKILKGFTGIQGTAMYNRFNSGEMVYIAYHFIKPNS